MRNTKAAESVPFGLLPSKTRAVCLFCRSAVGWIERWKLLRPIDYEDDPTLTEIAMSVGQSKAHM